MEKLTNDQCSNLAEKKFVFVSLRLIILCTVYRFTLQCNVNILQDSNYVSICGYQSEKQEKDIFYSLVV